MTDNQQRATLRQLRRVVDENTPRVAALGRWSDRAATNSLADRLPAIGPGGAVTLGMGGFDAGIACALDLIPRARQGLAAQLHAAYTPDAVAQARAELTDLHPDSDTAWWLAACHVCVEGRVDLPTLLDQLDRFHVLTFDAAARLAAARSAAADMFTSFELRDGLPFAVRDGGMQGAYLAGHELAAQYAADYGLYFLGTYRPSLGLESFGWRELGDPEAVTPEGRMGRSGPVGGSAQFVKCADEAEFRAAVSAAAPRG